MAYKRKTIFLTPQQLAALSKLEKSTGVSHHEHIRRAMDSYLKTKRKTSKK